MRRRRARAVVPWSVVPFPSCFRASLCSCGKLLLTCPKIPNPNAASVRPALLGTKKKRRALEPLARDYAAPVRE